MIYNKLVRDNVAGLLKSKGFAIKGKNLKGEQYTAGLYSLFLRDFKGTFDANLRLLQIYYADMLEVIRTLMINNGVNIKGLKGGESQPVHWYKNLAASDQKLQTARTDLLEKFYELLQVKTEAIKDQLNDIFNSFKRVLEANNISFVQIEKVRRAQFDRLGGFNKGVYLEGVSRIVEAKY